MEHTQELDEETILFNKWNEEQIEEYRITNRVNFTKVFPKIHFGPRVEVPSKKPNEDGKFSMNASCKAFQLEPNGREKAYYIDMPAVVSKRGFVTTENKASGKKSVSIPITLYRSNPDHLKFINGMLEIRTEAAKHIAATPMLKPGTKNISEILLKMSKLFYFEVDNDNIPNPESEEVYYFLTPLDYTDEEKDVRTKMEFYIPYKKMKNGKETNEWEKIEWEHLLDSDYGFEFIPKLKVFKISHGNVYALTTKCVSCCITRVFPKLKSNHQDLTLKTVHEKKENEENLRNILEKFLKISPNNETEEQKTETNNSENSDDQEDKEYTMTDLERFNEFKNSHN